MLSSEPESNMYGLYVVSREKHPEHWRAWREWYEIGLRRTFFPDTATTLFAWPPVTGEQAQMVLASLRKFQEDILDEAKRKKIPAPRLAPVPDIAPVYPKPPPATRRIASA